MNNITLRPASAADLPRIRRLILQNNLNIFGLRWERFTVAVDAAEQFVGCGQIRHHGDVDELASLVVIEEWQGRGVSRILMDALIERGKRPLWLMCESRLIPYYNQFGFKAVEEPLQLPSYFRNVYWVTRLPSGMMLLMRGTYLAFMVLNEG